MELSDLFSLSSFFVLLCTCSISTRALEALHCRDAVSRCDGVCIRLMSFLELLLSFSHSFLRYISGRGLRVDWTDDVDFGL